MNTWILFVILLQPTQYMVAPQGMHTSKEACEHAKNVFYDNAPKPKINYDAICIQTNQVEMK